MPDDTNLTPNTTLPDSTLTTGSEPSTMPSEALESSGNAVDPIPVNNANPAPSEPLSTSPEQESSPEISENRASQPQTSQMAQIPVIEPLAQPKSSLARELLIKARNVIQFRKRKKLDKIMALFLKQSKITNDEVEKYLHISDATATRYLSQLEKEGKIKQGGKTGTGVSYSRI